MIKQAVEKAEDFIARHKKYLSVVAYDYWIFFNNEGNPYIGIEQEKYFDDNTVNSNTIWLYKMDDNYDLRVLSIEKDAMISYDLNLLNKKVPHFKLNFIYAKEGGKGLGSELMTPLILNSAAKENIKVIVFFAPFDHGLKNKERVINFYKKFKFDIGEDAEANTYTASKFNKKDVDTAKLKIINYPAQNYDFKVVIPEKFLEHSSFKEEELSK